MRRLIAAFLYLPPCLADAAEPEDVARTANASHARLQEIVVTARRREESLEAVPIAVSVYSQAALDERQVVELAGLQNAVPNLHITTDQTNRAAALVSMRGQFEPGSVPTLDPTVGIYLDGVYVARITGANLRLIDMERVEVLRGPQGTLFGRNTIGGAISLVSSPPVPTFEGAVQGVIGDYDRLELAGMVNLPLTHGDQAFRLAALHAEHSGFGRSTAPGRDLDDEDTDYARARLRLTPAENWELNLFADGTRFRNGGQLRTLLFASPAASLVTIAAGNSDDDIQDYVDAFDRNVPANRARSVSTTASGAAAELAFHASHWIFKSITGWRALESLALQGDQDGTPYDLAAVLRRDDEQNQFSQEFQLLGDALDGRLEWIGGIIYFEERGEFDQDFLSFNPLSLRFAEQLPHGIARNESFAAYAQVVHAFAPRWRWTAGLRVNEDSRQLTAMNARRDGGPPICTLDPALLDSPGVCRATLPSRSFQDVPYTLGLDFRPGPQSLLYAKLSRGYRSGGYNLRGATEIDLGTFEPESVTAYEVGTKAGFHDGRLRLDLALFRSRFDDIQLLHFVVATGEFTPLPYIQNGGEARIEGGELELTAQLGRLRLAGALGIVDARYTELDPDVLEVTLDSQFLNTPDATASLAADWSQPTGFGTVDWHVDYAWHDEVPFAYDPASIARQKAYGLWNAQLRMHLERPGLDIALWVRNLTDERYLTRVLDSRVFMSASLGDPRTWGLAVGYRFGAD